MNRLLFCLPALALLGACTTLKGPGEVSGQVKAPPNMVVSAARIYEIDGATVHKDSAALDSGRRVVRIQALPQPGFRGGEIKEITVDVKPCTRYFLGVKRESERHFDWVPVMVGEEPMAGCTPKA